MKTRKILNRENGFTLIGIALLVLAIGIIAFIAGALGVKLQEIAKERNTVNRMTVIRNALKDYYRGHQDLPAPATGNRVPVGDLNLEQKYRLDAWGQFFHYYECRITFGGEQRTEINAFTVDGTQYLAGVIISSGPDQILDTTEPTCPTASVIKANDDIVVPINLFEEAQEIALEEMQVLREKVWAHQCAKGPGVAIELHDLTATYGLSDYYQDDPWLMDYVLFSEGILSGGPDEEEGTPEDNIVLGRLTEACANEQSPPPLPVESWGFNEGTGPTTAGGGGSVGTLQGGTAWSVETADGSESGLSFDGFNDFVQVTSSPLLNLSDTELSISLWVKVTDTIPVGGQVQPIIRKWLESGGGFGSYTIHRTAGNKIMGTVQNKTLSQYPSWETSSSLDVGYWHHVVFTYLKDRDGDGHVGSDDGKLYINGLEVLPATYVSHSYSDDFEIEYCNDSPDCDLYIGREAAPAWSDYFKGVLDQIEIYDVTLTDDEVKTLYYASAVARYLFHGNAIDSGWRGNNGTIHEASFASDRNGTANRALSFDGVNDWVDLGTGSSLNFRANLGGGIVAGGFTVMAWLKTSDGYGPVVSFRNSVHGGAVIDLAVGFDGHNCPDPSADAGKIMGLVRNDNEETGNYAQITGGPVNDGVNFYHVALSRGDAGSIELFLNGASQGTDTGSDANFSITTNLRALATERYWTQLVHWCTGWAEPEPRWWLNGVIDDVVIFPRNLSPAEINNFYNNLL